MGIIRPTLLITISAEAEKTRSSQVCGFVSDSSLFKTEMYNAVSTSSTTSFNDSQDTKLTVAELLSSLANGDTPTQFSSGVLTPTSLTSGIPSTLSSGTTPVLTPSTLASIEQIIDQQNQPSTSATESGFVPPLVEPITSTSVGS